MRKVLIALAMWGVGAGAVPLRAQDDGGGGAEIIVTAMRRLDPDDDRRVKEIVVTSPAAVQTLRRTADFAVQQVVITGDTNDEATRHAEI